MKDRANKRVGENIFSSQWKDCVDGVRIIDSAGSIKYVNEVFCEFAGMTEDELTQKAFFFPYAGQNEFYVNKIEEFREKFEKRKIIPFYKAQISFQNNKTYCFEVTNTYINKKDENMLLLSVFHKTETSACTANRPTEDAQPGYTRLNELELLLERERRKSFETEELINMAFENSDDVIWVMNNDLKFTYISPSITKTRGYSVEEAMSQTLSQSMSTEGFKAAMELINSKKQAGIEEMKKAVLLEAHHPCKDGSYIWAESKVKFLLDKEGNPVGILGISRDISARKRAEQLLRESKNYLSSIINNIGDPLFIKDSNFKCVLANDAFCKILNRDIGDVVNKYDYELFGRSECEVFNQNDNLVLSTGEQNLSEEYYLDAEGKKHTVLTKKTRFIDENGNKFIVGTINDITQLKEADRLLRQALEKEKNLNSLKTDFVSMVSHEFRTPLTTILTSTQLIQQYYEDLKKEEKDEIFGHVYTGVQKMIMLLDDILLLGGTESGKRSFSPAMMDIETFSRNIEKELRLNNGSHKINIKIESKTGRMYGDEKLLNQILMNLLTNAIKYSPEGKDIFFRIYEQEKSVCFEVEDSGIGIAPGDKEKLFEPFFRGSNTEGISGTGLGLAIVKKSVEMHQGSIECMNGEREGTIFKVKIPLNININH